VYGLSALLFVAACSNDDAQTPEDKAAQSSPDAAAPASAPPAITAVSDFDPAREYDTQCPTDDDEESLECHWLHALVVADVVEALEGIDHSRDKRGVEEALAALDLEDEPEILIAASRILGRFPDTPGIAEKITPLFLESPYLKVRELAAEVLIRNPDQNLSDIADEWFRNRPNLDVDDPYEGLPDVPAQYAAMGFPEYPGAQRYMPADADRALGWWTSEPAKEVADRLAAQLGVETMDYLQWTERTQQEVMQAYASIDQSKLDEIQKLADEFARTQDMKLIERVEKLQVEMNAPMQKAQDDLQYTMNEVAIPTGAYQPDQVYYLIAEERAGHVARLIMIYRQPGIDRTIMQMAWDLRDYQPAWGDAQ
jgi:hypothetical protein